MNAAGRTYRRLRAGILAGSYESGERLGEVETAGTLGVSRTPVREALRRLSAEGFVELLPNRGARVATWLVKDIEEVYDLRVCLESYGAAHATSHAAEDDLAYLERLCDREAAIVRTGERIEEVLDVKADYHHRVMRLAANQRLSDLVTPLIEVQSVLRTFRRYPRERLLRQVDDHRVLVQAFRVRDPEWAAAVMRAHLIGAKDGLLEDKRRAEESARTELADGAPR